MQQTILTKWAAAVLLAATGLSGRAAITLNAPADYSTAYAKSSGARSVNAELANGAFTTTTSLFKTFATKSKASGDARDTLSKGYNASGLVTLAWSGAASGRECTVTIRRAKDRSVARTLKSKTGSVQFVSPEIGRNYIWTVSDGTTTSAEGHFYVAADAPRILNVSATDWAISNARDLGGWKTADGKVVRQGLVYRSPQFDWYMPGYVDPDDTEHPGPRIGAPFHYDTLGIRFDLDLRKIGDVRANEYVEYRPASGPVDIRVSPLGPGIPRFFTDYDDESAPFGNYSGIFSLPAMKAMHKAFAKVAENLRSGTPLVFHCAQGKDRTGSLAYVLNGLLGVPRESLRLDWAWTYVADSSSKTTELLIDQIEQGLNASPYNTVSGIPARLEKYVKACYTAGGATEAQAASDIATLREKMLETPETPAENPGGFAFNKFYWRRQASGGSWESSTGYWYKQPTGTEKWNPISPVTQQDAVYLLPLADAKFCYAEPANGGKIELGYIESDATCAKTGSVGVDTTKPRFSNAGLGVTERAVWVHKAGKAYANNVDFYFDGTGTWWVEIRGGTTFAFRDFQVMENANCGVRFPEGDCDGATLEIEPNDDNHWTSKFAWLGGGAAGTRQALTVRNALAQVYASGRTSGVAGALDLRFELGANNTTSSAAMLAVTGTLKVNAGSTLSVDAGQKPAGTYRLVGCGTLACDAALYTGATVANCRAGTYGVVEKKGAALNLVVRAGSDPGTDKLATLPAAKTGLAYTGRVQTGVEAGTGYTIAGNTATDAKSYQATVTLEAGYKWADGSTAATRTIPWSIAKGANAWTSTPSVTPSSWTEGSAPATISFSNGANAFGAAVTCDTSAAALKALAGGASKVVTFTAAASANWEALTHAVTVSVAKKGGEAEPHATFAWLKTDARGFFDTGLAPDQGATRVEMEVEFLSASNETALFGASSHITQGKGWDNGFDVYLAEAGRRVVFENWNNATGTGTEDNEFDVSLAAGRHTFVASQNVLTIDGRAYTATLSGGNPVTGTAGSNLFLFRNNEGGGQDVLKLYAARIYRGDTLLHDYAPATNATGVACLYDAVTMTCLLPTDAIGFEVGDDETPTIRTASLPAPRTGLVYNGTEQTGVEDGLGCTVTAGGTATAAGSHAATVALQDGYEWPDAPKTGVRTVSWSIAKGANQWTVKPSVTPASWKASAPPAIAISTGATEFGASVTCDTTAETLRGLAAGTSKTVTFTAAGDGGNYDALTFKVTVTAQKDDEEEPDYVAWHWGRKTRGATWTSTSYWYKDETATTPWKAYPDAFDACVYLVQTAGATNGVGPALQEGVFDIGKVVTRGETAVGYGTLVFRNPSASERTLWTTESGSFAMNAMTFRMSDDSTSGLALDIRGGATLRFDNGFAAPANVGIRLADDTAGATVRFTDGQNALGFLAGGRAGVTHVLEIDNARVTLAQASGVAGPLKLALRLDASNTSEPSLACEGAFAFASGSTLTVDAARLAAGTYPLVSAAALSGADDVAATANVTNTATGTTAKVVKNGSALALVVKTGGGDDPEAEPHAEFQWLKTDAHGYFDTRFAPDQGATRVEMEVEFLSASNETALFGASSHIAKGTGWDDGFDVYLANGASLAIFENWNNATGTETKDNEFAVSLAAGRHTFAAEQNVLTIDGRAYTATLSGGNPVTGTAGSNLFLFRNNEGGGQDVLKLYAAKVYVSGALVHDYVPATNATGMACLYDKVAKTCLLPTDATAFEVGNDGSDPDPPVVETDVTIAVDATGTRGRALTNPESSLTFWGGPASVHDYPAFCMWAQSFCATGGSRARDLFANPDDRTVTDDYDFSKLVRICRAACASGLKPYVKLGNVPLKLSSAPFLSKSYEVNVRPPDDDEAYYRYMKGAAQALVDEFGKDEVRTWRFSVLTEANNLSWFAAAPGGKLANTNAVTKAAFFRLYDWTTRAFTEVVGDDVLIGTHLLAANDSNNKSFTYQEFIAHCKSGKNAATGGTGAPLKLLAFSYYFNHPDDDNLAAGVPEDWRLFRDALDAAGFADAIVTLDEGRVYQGKNLGDRKTSLPTRAVGMSWQAAFDFRLAKTLWENGGDTFATWGARSGEETLYEGFDTVVSLTGRELARFEGLRMLAPSVASQLSAKESVDAVAAVDDDDRTVRFAASRFRDKLEFTASATAAFRVTLPQAMRGRTATLSFVAIDDTNNWFADWVRGIGTNGFTADDIYCNRYDQSPLLGLWADESKARFQREFASRYEAQAKSVVPTTRTLDVPADGVVTIPFTFVGNAVVFGSVSLDDETCVELKPSDNRREATVSAGSAEKACAKVVLVPPEGSDVPPRAYRAYFDIAATASGVEGRWNVSADLRTDETMRPVFASVGSTKAIELAGDRVSLSLANAKPGLFYGLAASDDPRNAAAEPSDWKCATADTLSWVIPVSAAKARFFRAAARASGASK